MWKKTIAAPQQPANKQRGSKNVMSARSCALTDNFSAASLIYEPAPDNRLSCKNDARHESLGWALTVALSFPVRGCVTVPPTAAAAADTADKDEQE